MVARKFWLEHVFDAYVRACAEGRDWQKAVAEAEQAPESRPLKVLTTKDLQARGIVYSRQHINRKVRNGTFPPPFRFPTGFDS
jgi:hypothetical protein